MAINGVIVTSQPLSVANAALWGQKVVLSMPLLHALSFAPSPHSSSLLLMQRFEHVCQLVVKLSKGCEVNISYLY